jgi:chromosome partitioning protein
MRAIAFMNQKGGVGKTTCAVNLSAALALKGRKVLLVDIDPQANASIHLAIDVHDLERSIYHVLTGMCSVRDAILTDIRPGLSVLPANIDLSGAEIELVNAVGRETILRDALGSFLAEEPCDFVIFDCPPSLGLLSLNALTAAREVIIPLQTEFFALQGMVKLLEVIRLIQKRLNHRLEIAGVLPTIFDGRTNLGHEVIAEIRKFFGDKVYRTAIRNTVKLAEAPGHGKTIFEYADDSMAAVDFRELALEVLAQDGGEASRPADTGPLPAPPPSPPLGGGDSGPGGGGEG